LDAQKFLIEDSVCVIADVVISHSFEVGCVSNKGLAASDAHTIAFLDGSGIDLEQTYL
jgi:hypothetical protein